MRRTLVDARRRWPDQRQREQQIMPAVPATAAEARAVCRAALRQWNRYSARCDAAVAGGGAAEAASAYAEGCLLLDAVAEAVEHAARVERLLAAAGQPAELPVPTGLRERASEASALMGSCRDEQALVWRLFGRHTERAVQKFRQAGVPLRAGPIQTWAVVGADGDALVGLGELRAALAALDAALGPLARPD